MVDREHCLALNVNSNFTVWKIFHCNDQLKGAVCEHDLLEPKYVGCHAHISEEVDGQHILQLKEDETLYQQREHCRLFCQGASYFQISFDQNCTCLTRWPTGGNYNLCACHLNLLS